MTLTRDLQAPDRVLRTGLALLSATSVTWISSLAMLLVMPRAVGPAGLGIYATAGTVAGLAGMLATCGMSQVTVRQVARRPEETASIVMRALVARVALWGVLVVLGLPLALYMFDPGEARVVLALVMIRAATASLGAVAAEGLQGLQSLGKFAIIKSTLAMLTELAAVALLLLGHGVVAVVMLGAAMAAVRASIAWAMLAVRAMGRWRVTLAQVAEMSRAGLSFLTVDLALVVYGGAGTLILANVLGASAVGPFALANRIVSVVTTTPSIVAGAVFPALAAAHLDRERFRALLATSLRIVVAGTLPMGAGLALLAPEVVHLLGGPSGYTEAIPILRIAGIALPLVGVDVILATALVSLNRQRVWAVCTAIMAVASFPLTYLGVIYADRVWANGGVGAAMTPALLEIAMSAIAMRMLGTTLNTRSLFQSILKATVCVAVMCLVVELISAAGLFAAIAAGAAVYATAALLLGLVSASDLVSIKDAVLNQRRQALPSATPASG